MNNRTRNHLVFASNIAVFWPGFNLMSPVTILPVFVSFLTDSSILIGSIPPLAQIAYAIPLIYGARYFEGRPYKCRRLVTIVTIGRMPFIAFGAFVIIAGGRPSVLLLVLFFLALFSLGGTTGFSYAAWADTFSKVVDRRSRGRLIGISQTVGGGIAGVAVLAATRLMGDDPFPIGFGILFIVAALILTLAYGQLVLLKEPPSPPVESDPNPIWRAASRIPRLLRQDPNFRSLIIARLLIGYGMTSFGFFAIFATRRFDITVEQIGLLTTILLITQTIANLGSGYLNDRIGSVRLAAVGGLGALIAAVLAATALDPIALYPIFMCVGFSQAAFAIADFTLVLDAAPRERMPTYLATYNVGVSPLLLPAALAAGLLVDIAGFRPMFIASAVLGLAGIVLMSRVARRQSLSETSALTP